MPLVWCSCPLWPSGAMGFFPPRGGLVRTLATGVVFLLTCCPMVGQHCLELSCCRVGADSRSARKPPLPKCSAGSTPHKSSFSLFLFFRVLSPLLESVILSWHLSSLSARCTGTGFSLVSSNFLGRRQLCPVVSAGLQRSAWKLPWLLSGRSPWSPAWLSRPGL